MASIVTQAEDGPQLKDSNTEVGKCLINNQSVKTLTDTKNIIPEEK
jgi:hypothetical protein